MAKEIYGKRDEVPFEPVLISVELRNNGEGYGAPQDLVCVYKLPDGSMVKVVESSWDDLYKTVTLK